MAVALLALVHGLLYLLYFRSQALGQVPVLDGREMLTLSLAFADGSGFGEPFYRAPLYPLVLSGMLRLGLPTDLLMAVAQTLNVVCHAISVWLVFRIARLVWPSNQAALLSGLLYALYPVAVFFAGEPLDAAFAIMLMLVSVKLWLQGLRSISDRQAMGLYLAAAGFAMLAFSARPQMLTVGLGMAVASPLLGATRRRVGIIFSLGLLLGLLLFAGANRVLNGEFVGLPTQGGYNLWAANGPQANGFYFKHQLPAWAIDPQENPARYESRYLYLQSQGLASDFAVDEREVSAYWSKRTIQHVLAHPGQWATLAGRKLAALLHDHEQYNNKTYVFHQQASPVLQFNPLSWVWIATLALVGWAVGGLRRDTAALSVVVICYVGGVLLSYASARFRLPLVPVMCVLAGGVVMIRSEVVARLKRLAVPVLASTAVLIVFANWSFDWANSEATIAEDWMLQASAQYRLGRTEASLASVDQAVALNPDQLKAWSLGCSIGFNALLDQWADQAGPSPEDRLLESCRRAAPVSRSSKWALGTALWIGGRSEQALVRWRELRDIDDIESERALACLVFAGRANTLELDELANMPVDSRGLMLLFASERLGDEQAKRYLESRFKPNWLQGQRRLYLNIFPETGGQNNGASRPQGQVQ
jgi:tetratricopeptide (TPR) repeat protein